MFLTVVKFSSIMCHIFNTGKGVMVITKKQRNIFLAGGIIVISIVSPVVGLLAGFCTFIIITA